MIAERLPELTDHYVAYRRSEGTSRRVVYRLEW